MHKRLVKDRQILHQQLLVLASRRKPWKQAQPLRLPTRVDKHTLDAAASLVGLPQLCGLPVELLEMIRDHSAHSLFWRSLSALRLACVSDTRDESQPQVVALQDVISWERGGRLERGQSRTLPPIIRLTMDSDGISRVERLSGHPRYSRGSYTHTAYIVGSIDDLALCQVEAQLAVCTSYPTHLFYSIPAISSFSFLGWSITPPTPS